MELTIMSKKRYDELLTQIRNLETQTAFVQSQLTAMQDSNNHLADIAFDENKFTNALLDKVEEVAREVAKHEVQDIDTEEIAREAVEFIDVRAAVDEMMARSEYLTRDDVSDIVDDCVGSLNLVNEDEAEDLIENHIAENCGFVEKDVTDQLHEDIRELRKEMQEMKQEIINAVIEVLINKLTGKEIDHADNNHEGNNGVHISGTVGHSQEQGNGTLIS